jgi:hypothetical protein
MRHGRRGRLLSTRGRIVIRPYGGVVDWEFTLTVSWLKIHI